MSGKKKYESKDINSNAVIRELRNLSSLLKDLLIIELGAKGVKQTEIRKIVGGDIHRVNRILKYFKT
jgi:hypothetical protein